MNYKKVAIALQNVDGSLFSSFSCKRKLSSVFIYLLAVSIVICYFYQLVVFPGNPHSRWVYLKMYVYTNLKD